MKPTSIIFLIVSVLLIISGIITMGVANRLGAAEGIVLAETPGDSDEHTVTYEYENGSVLKITASVRDADVNIIGGAARSYVELINFFEGTYELTESNRVLTVRDSVDLTSPDGIASFAMNFKGLRGIVNQINSMGLKKTVNIYLSDVYPVNVVECSVGEGSVIITGNKSATDYIINIEKGNIQLTDVTTTSKLDATIVEGGVILDNCGITRFVCDLENGSVQATAKLSRVEADIAAGDFLLKLIDGLEIVGFELVCQSGSVNFNGINHGGIFLQENPTTENLIAVTVGVGDIVVEG